MKLARTIRIASLSVTVMISVIALASCRRGTDSSPLADESLLTASFDVVEAAARGTTVTFYQWGGSDAVNSWIDGFVSNRMRELYDITIERVPMDAPVFVNKLKGEREANKDPGVIDLMWINGENFRNAREADLLFGPFADRLPNFSDFVDPASGAVDAGFPTEGYEAPYGKAQFNYDYDSARVSDPPRSFVALAEWVRRHPGRFTYPQPPDFTGSAFIRQAFYAITGGYEQYIEGFDQELFDRNSPALWEYLDSLEPFLWQRGESYPRDLAALDTLFERGEVDFTMSFTQTNAATRIANGRYPTTARSLVFEDGSLYNTHFTAIAFNAPNKAGAMLLANFLLSPEAQLSKQDPAKWGDFTVLSPERLTEEFRAAFELIDLGEATVPIPVLDRYGVPEIPAEYWEALERGWDRNVRNN